MSHKPIKFLQLLEEKNFEFTIFIVFSVDKRHSNS